MRADIDKFIETMTEEQFIEQLTALNPSDLFGFHLGQISENTLDKLANWLAPGSKLPVQIMSGPALSLRYWSCLPPKMCELIKTEKIKCYVHLPFVLTFYRDPKHLGYQVAALRELSNLYHQLGIWDKVTVLAHCGHPALNENELDLTGNQAKSWFISNVNQVSVLFKDFLIENLPGHRGQLVDFSSLPALYEIYHEDLLHLKFVLDTEHLYAGGKVFEDITPEMWERIALVHFNAAPPNAKFGEFVDLHSFTSINSSVQRACGPFSISGNEFSAWQSELIKRGIPSVFERKVYSIQLEDYKLLTNQ